jgi:hypothetical protein
MHNKDRPIIVSDLKKRDSERENISRQFVVGVLERDIYIIRFTLRCVVRQILCARIAFSHIY